MSNSANKGREQGKPSEPGNKQNQAGINPLNVQEQGGLNIISYCGFLTF